MVALTKHVGPIQPGTYIIRSVLSSTDLNLIRKTPDGPLSVCIWDVLDSPTQKWIIERSDNKAGFSIRNAAVNAYISFEGSPKKSSAVICSGHQDQWKIREVGENYHIQVPSNRNFALEVKSMYTVDGTEIVLEPLHSEGHQQWSFYSMEEQPPSYSNPLHIGLVPAGIYWLGQPDDVGGPAVAKTSPSIAAMTVPARRPIPEGQTTSVHLSIVTDVPWPNQIWALEPGTHGYRMRNIGTNTYLNYVRRKPVIEPSSVGLSSISEWLVKPGTISGPKRSAYLICPCANVDDLLGARKGDNFNQLNTKSIFQHRLEAFWEWVYLEWRFESITRDVLDLT